MADPQTAEKKAKPPALEDKPFAEFIETHFIPSLAETLKNNGVSDLALQFTKETLPTQRDECWQVRGQWSGGRRSFLVAFPEESIGGVKVFACADANTKPTDLEPFLGDERKITLDLLVFGVMRRLNGQKWLGLN
ncbi:MAG: DUF2996 domain-containing protein [Prochlorotrichaceae cyanobacterium]|jgi:hypothetical protein